MSSKIKFFIDRDYILSEKIQEYLLSLGYRWQDGSRNLYLSGIMWLYVTDGVMSESPNTIEDGVEIYTLEEKVVYFIQKKRDKICIDGNFYYIDEVKNSIKELNPVSKC